MQVFLLVSHCLFRPVCKGRRWLPEKLCFSLPLYIQCSQRAEDFVIRKRNLTKFLSGFKCDGDGVKSDQHMIFFSSIIQLHVDIDSSERSLGSPEISLR